MTYTKFALLGVTLALLCVALTSREVGSFAREDGAGMHGALGATKVWADYQRWARAHLRAGGDRSVHIALIGAHGARGPGRTRGSARIDLHSGRVELHAESLPEGRFDAWLVGDNVSGAESETKGSQVIRLGALDPASGAASLAVALEPGVLRQLRIERLSVTRAGEGPAAAVLHGTPTLFQRLHAQLEQPRSRAVDAAPRPRLEQVLGALLGVREAHAEPPDSDAQALLAGLIERGARVFQRETFAGNGRTCASCHPLEHGTTLSVTDIARLPDRDPLFAAEFQPALAFSQDGPKFEVPMLLRGAALILANADGFQDLRHKFVLRGIPHTRGLRTSIEPGLDGTPTPPVHRMGWGGDGGSGDGSLRAFAIRAVEQHFTRTLDRVPGRDFRLPSAQELDALEAFQLSLGRQEELRLPLALRDPIVARGQQLFLARGPEGAGNCVVCHLDAGANALFAGKSGGNFIFATGVEAQADRPAELILASLGLDLAPEASDRRLPPDGGFADEGNPKQFGGGVGSLADGFGTGFFNTPSLVEAASTPPFFHDNSIRTIEGAVAFYNTRQFRDSVSGQADPTNLEATQIEAIAAFLRALNALDSIREARQVALALSSLSARVQRRDGALFIAEVSRQLASAIRVLREADLQPETSADLESLRSSLGTFDKSGATRKRLHELVERLDRIRSTLITD